MGVKPKKLIGHNPYTQTLFQRTSLYIQQRYESFNNLQTLFEFWWCG